MSDSQENSSPKSYFIYLHGRQEPLHISAVSYRNGSIDGMRTLVFTNPSEKDELVVWEGELQAMRIVNG